jgi:hypothetical protein
VAADAMPIHIPTFEFSSDMALIFPQGIAWP